MLKTFSGKIILIIAFVLALNTEEKIYSVLEGNDTCICSYDGFGYYVYLPQLFRHGDLQFNKSWAQDLQNKYCDGTEAYQIITYKNGSEINIYHMGMAYLYAPSYIVGDLFARTLDYPRDGMSTPYHIAFILNSFLFLFLGLFYLRKLLSLFVKDKTVGLSLLILFAASNAIVTFDLQFELPHLYLFTLNTIFLYCLLIFKQSQKLKYLLISAAILGLTSCIRPTQALLGIIPIILLYRVYPKRSKYWLCLIWFPLFGILWNLPQFYYWKLMGDDLFLFNLHTEEIILPDPNFIDFLFSYKKGWLLYSPIFLLLIPAFRFLYKEHRRLFWAFSIFVLMYIYVMSAWECWWYAASYGSRVMVDIYPALAVVLALFFESIRSSKSNIVVSIFIGLCTWLNFVQSAQYYKGYLHPERMTKAHYWYIFGKTDMPDYKSGLLELDRSDLNWIDHPEEFPKEAYSIKKQRLFNLKTTLRNEPLVWTTVGMINPMHKLTTDESLLEVSLSSKTSDSTKSVELKMETCSIYNCYDWKTLEVSLGLSQDTFVNQKYRFNLVNIRHKDDYIQMYLVVNDSTQIEMKDFNVTSYSLIRE